MTASQSCARGAKQTQQSCSTQKQKHLRQALHGSKGGCQRQEVLERCWELWKEDRFSARSSLNPDSHETPVSEKYLLWSDGWSSRCRTRSYACMWVPAVPTGPCGKVLKRASSPGDLLCGAEIPLHSFSPSVTTSLGISLSAQETSVISKAPLSLYVADRHSVLRCFYCCQ